MVVYLITNLINGKKYVGQTIQRLKRRWDFHVYRGSGCMALKSAIEKYGKENFKIEEVHRAASLEELCQKEQELIASHNTLAPNGYNLTTGGERPIYSEESRKKMSISASKRSSWAKGKTLDDPRIVKSISAATRAMREIYGESGPNKGHKWNEESRKKMSERQTGRVLSDETKNKISNSHQKTKIICEQNCKLYDSIMDAARDLNLNSGNIHGVLSGRHKHTKGYTFKRV